MTVKNERWTAGRIVYAILLGGMLLDYLLIQAVDHEAYSLSAIVAGLRLLTALTGISLGKLWKDKGFLFLASLLVIQTLRVLFTDPNLLITQDVSENLLTGLWAIGGCYALARVLTYRQIKIFLRIFITAWTVGMVVHCSIALYAGWKDIHIMNLSGGSFWGIRHSKWGTQFPERLQIGFVYPTVGGSALSLSGVTALGAMLAEKKKGLKIWFGAAFLIILVTLGMTDTRASYVSLSVGVGAIVLSAVLHLLLTKGSKQCKQTKIHKPVWVWTASIGCMLVAAAVTLFLVLKVAPVYNTVKTGGGLPIAKAAAEAEQEEETEETIPQPKQQIISRGFSGEGFLSGRTEVWSKVIEYLRNHPTELIFGASVHDSMAGPNQEMEIIMAHCHNMPIQLLLENGLVGLVPILCFAIYTLLNGLRILNSRTTPLWLRLIPALPASALVGDLAECFVWFRSWTGAALAFAFVAFGMINTWGAKKAETLS